MAKARRKICAVSLPPPNQKTAFRHSYHEEKQSVKGKIVWMCAKKSDNLGNRATLGGKKAKLLHPPRLYKVASSLDGDTGLLIAQPTVVDWFVYYLT